MCTGGKLWRDGYPRTETQNCRGYSQCCLSCFRISLSLSFLTHPYPGLQVVGRRRKSKLVSSIPSSCMRSLQFFNLTQCTMLAHIWDGLTVILRFSDNVDFLSSSETVLVFKVMFKLPP